MIVITGGAGFIGSALLWRLNQLKISDIVVIDDLGTQDKWRNLVKRQLRNIIPISQGIGWLTTNAKDVDFVFHMGACSTTTEVNADYLFANNVHYSMSIYSLCTANNIPLVYASSAATYGNGEQGYSDSPETQSNLRPINKYGYSKHFFDEWALCQKKPNTLVAGLKFFNVYGPQEYHKGSQASVIYHAYPQVRDRQVLRLFKSYREDFADGEQRRDFIYIKDVVDVMASFYENPTKKRSGIFNVGTGKARSFLDLGRGVFEALDVGHSEFDFIDMPEGLKNQYQYHTEADLQLLRNKANYSKSFTSLEDGIRDYVQGYLLKDDPFL